MNTGLIKNSVQSPYCSAPSDSAIRRNKIQRPIPNPLACGERWKQRPHPHALLLTLNPLASLLTLNPLASKVLTHIAGFDLDLKSPAAAPSIADEAGVFGEDCQSAESASSAAACFGEKRREAEGRGGGCRFLWLLSFWTSKRK